jgi:hypothetical protein
VGEDRGSKETDRCPLTNVTDMHRKLSVRFGIRMAMVPESYHRGGLFVDMSRLQRGQRSGLLPRMPWQGSKTKSLLVYGTDLGWLEMQMRCSKSSQNSTLSLYGPR